MNTLISIPAALLLSSSVATLRSSFCSLFSNASLPIAIGIILSEAEGSHSSTFDNSIEHLRSFL